jgi:putative oxidoreductase
MSATFVNQPCNATIPRIAAAPFLPFVGRAFLAAIFLIAGTMKFLNWEATAAYMQEHHLPLVNVFLPLAATAELAGGIALLFGGMTKWASSGLILFLIPATLIFHNFWAQTGVEAQDNMHHFLKNVAIIGGLLLLIAFGPGPLSRDAWSKERALPPR